MIRASRRPFPDCFGHISTEVSGYFASFLDGVFCVRYLDLTSVRYLDFTSLIFGRALLVFFRGAD